MHLVWFSLSGLDLRAEDAADTDTDRSMSYIYMYIVVCKPCLILCLNNKRHNFQTRIRHYYTVNDYSVIKKSPRKKVALAAGVRLTKNIELKMRGRKQGWIYF